MKEEIIIGLTKLDIEIGNVANPEVMVTLEVLIDSGAIYSVIPSPILKKLGIKPREEQVFRLADGSKIVRNKGTALFKYGNKTGGADVIFGEKDDSTLLGAFTLEALGLALNPLKRELIPLPMVL
ncbi:MAG: aspartyl protease family protein [Candidatus Hatepunaea meridiana]|nr:aspartyl protease family protein [Candidatus Hatepunaea meridiana]